MLDKTKINERILLVCFLFSGAAGLIYEVVWSRQLSLFVGITTYAHTAVVTAYMLGLALGSYFIGRMSDRHPSPLRLFAWLEVAIALYAGITPWLINWLQITYAQFAVSIGVTGLSSHLLRFLVVLVLLLPPTFLMGGTLPVMIRGMTRRMPDLANSSSIWYGINTLGAVAGTMLAGYLLIPRVGMRNTLFVGVVFDLLVAAVVLYMCRKGRNPVHIEDSTYSANGRSYGKSPVDAPVGAWSADASPALSPGQARYVLLVFALSGFSALTYQIAWIRALTLVLGSSVYSFTTTLASFLIGIGLGSLAYTRLPGGENNERRLIQAAVFMVIMAWSALISLMLIGKLPELFLWGFNRGWGMHFSLLQVFMFALSLAVMIVPTFLMGALFPLMAMLWTKGCESLGRDIGVIYSANTVGCIIGSVSAGLVLLPAMGVHGTIMFAAGVHVVAGLGLLGLKFASWRWSRRCIWGMVIPAVTVCIILLVPPWDKKIMTSGVFNYTYVKEGQSPSEALAERSAERRLLYYQDGRDGTVSVLESAVQRLLIINGKIDASSVHDIPTQTMLAHLPIMMHPHPRRVMIVGLGSGITAGTVALHAGVESIDILEISPEVVAASAYFSESNRSVLEDPRVHLIIADARNYLQGTDREYDVIISEPSNPWISGISNLFTLEYFKLLRSRLAPGGISCQWMHIYNMSKKDVCSILNSYQAVFENVSLWNSLNSDLLILGSREFHAVDADYFNRMAAIPVIHEQLIQIGKNNLNKVVQMFLTSGDSLAAFSHGYSINTDDRPLVEFSAPRNLYIMTTEDNLRSLIDHQANNPVDPPVKNLVQVDGPKLNIVASGLDITTARELEPEQWVAGYNVWRNIIKPGGGASDVVGVGSHLVVEWQDNDDDHRLITIFQENVLSLEQLETFLLVDESKIVLAKGEVDLPGGARGAWVLSRGKEPTIWVAYAITWMVPAPFGGFYQHIAERLQADPGTDQWGPALIAFAKCLSPAETASR